MKTPKLTAEHLLVLLGGLTLAACDKKQETPAAEQPTASAAAPAPSPTPAASQAPVEAKEVPAATGDGGAKKAGGKEKKCTPGGCAPGACG